MLGYSKRVWGWMMWDWASQPYFTLLVTFIFAPYFGSHVVGDPVAGQSMILITTSIVGLIIALTGPILGAFSDQTGRKKSYILYFSILYMIGSAGLWWAVPDMENVMGILLLFAIGLIAAEIMQIFINAMLYDMGEQDQLGRIGGNAWAFGYLGALILLFLMLLFFFEADAGKTILGNAPVFGLDAEMREGTRAAGPLTAIWYLIFIIPFFLWVKDTPKPTAKFTSVAGTLAKLWLSVKDLKNKNDLSFYLASSLFYRDALIGIYAIGGLYASGVLEWTTSQLAIFGILGLISGTIFSYLGGYFDRAMGPKRTITWCIFILIGTAIVVIGISKDSFMGVPLGMGSTLPDKLLYAAGMSIGAAGGVIQSASRTMLIKQSKPEELTQNFGLYALAGKSTAWMTTLLMGVVTALTKSQQMALIPVVIFFVIGLGLLFWVNEDS